MHYYCCVYSRLHDHRTSAGTEHATILKALIWRIPWFAGQLVSNLIPKLRTASRITSSLIPSARPQHICGGLTRTSSGLETLAYRRTTIKLTKQTVACKAQDLLFYRLGEFESKSRRTEIQKYLQVRAIPPGYRLGVFEKGESRRIPCPTSFAQHVVSSPDPHFSSPLPQSFKPSLQSLHPRTLPFHLLLSLYPSSLPLLLPHRPYRWINSLFPSVVDSSTGWAFFNTFIQASLISSI